MTCSSRTVQFVGLVVVTTFLSIAQCDRINAATELLVNADELQRGEVQFEIVDVRSEEQFATGHLTGAVWIDANAWKTASNTETKLRDVEFWQTQIRKAGVTDTKPVLVVGDSPTTSARIWWLLKYAGVRDVRILDGGLSSVVNVKLVQTVTDVSGSDFTATLRPERLATLKEIAGADSPQVMDCRSDGEFSGEIARGRGGHIPGARQLEWSQFLDDQGCYRSSEEIRKLVAAAGLDPKRAIAAHCQTGARSSVAVFAMELAGISKAKNYYLGWGEYGGTELPLEK